MSNNLLYAFNINRTDYEANRQLLGLAPLSTAANTDAEKARLVSGTTRPRPGRASLEDAVTGSTFSTFYTTANADALVAAGWTLSSEILE